MRSVDSELTSLHDHYAAEVHRIHERIVAMGDVDIKRNQFLKHIDDEDARMKEMLDNFDKMEHDLIASKSKKLNNILDVISCAMESHELKDLQK
ncbi:MAG TPA: hypothetical protein PK926_14385 [Spirochaetota bacterium]|nr:hypothetical protein [Spirochaetota bacterium]HPI91189.1 hypothetical protein [Spirochaetota bacterium]HPR49477.1 hypothetical protein [Spirochaetota bacterium]